MIGINNYVNTVVGVSTIESLLNNRKRIEYSNGKIGYSSFKVMGVGEVYKLTMSNGAILYLDKSAKLATKDEFKTVEEILEFKSYGFIDCLRVQLGSVFKYSKDKNVEKFIRETSAAEQSSLAINPDKLVMSWDYNDLRMCSKAWELLLSKWERSVAQVCLELSADYEIPNFYQGEEMSLENDKATLEYVWIFEDELLDKVDPSSKETFRKELRNLRKFQGKPLQFKYENLAIVAQSSLIRAGYNVWRDKEVLWLEKESTSGVYIKTAELMKSVLCEGPKDKVFIMNGFFVKSE